MSDDGLQLQPLEARFVGPFSVERFNRQLTRAISEAVLAGCRRVLVDTTRLTGPISLADRYDIAVHGADAAAGFRVSVLAAVDQIEPRRFGVLVANHSRLEVNVSHERGAALAWLFRDAVEGATGSVRRATRPSAPRGSGPARRRRPGWPGSAP